MAIERIGNPQWGPRIGAGMSFQYFLNILIVRGFKQPAFVNLPDQ